jgi:hypothetical protein
VKAGRVVRLAAMIAGAALTAAPAMADMREPQQFGLVCVGTEETPGEPDKPWKRSFSIDLSTNQATVVGSGGAFDIAVTESQIRLLWGGDTVIDRVGGSYSEIDRLLSRFVSGTCSRAAFTPLPAKKF